MDQGCLTPILISSALAIDRTLRFRSTTYALKNERRQSYYHQNSTARVLGTVLFDGHPQLKLTTRACGSSLLGGSE